MLITKAPPAQPITLNAAEMELFRDTSGEPCLLSIPASSGLDLMLLDVVASGSVKANQPGTLQVGLFALANQPNMGTPTVNTGDWVLIGSCPAEPVEAGPTSWMIAGQDLMYNLANGKMQGTFLSNVADAPIAAADLNTNPNDLRGDVSPVMYFAVGAMFTPDDDDGQTPVLEMANFILAGEI